MNVNELNCEICGSKFVKIGRHHKYCSPKCRERSKVNYVELRSARECPHCKQQFMATQLQKFCSISCAARSNRHITIAKNKTRRIYPENPILNRKQQYYRMHGYKNSKDKDLRVKLVNQLGGCCVKCGYSKDVRALVLDHKFGDGFLDRKRVGNKIARYYVNHVEEASGKLQVLCANCNMIKSAEDNEHNRTRRVGRVTDLSQFVPIHINLS